MHISGALSTDPSSLGRQCSNIATVSQALRLVPALPLGYSSGVVTHNYPWLFIVPTLSSVGEALNSLLQNILENYGSADNL